MRIKRPVILFLLFMGFSAVGSEKPNEWEALNSEIISLIQEGQYDKATVIAWKALAVAEETVEPHHANIATSLDNLAFLYEKRGQYTQAEAHYKRSLAIREKTLGSSHPDVVQTLDNLANLYRATNRISKAKELEQRAARIKAIRHKVSFAVL